MARLGSIWRGLNPHLIASIYQCNKQGEIEGDTYVCGPLTESNLEISLNWQSPFESAGAESKAPALASMLQSGMLQPLVDAVMPDGSKKDEATEVLKNFYGKTGITKLNSTQVFSGMPPVKIQISMLLRAWSDPKNEVEAPFNQLVEWGLPEELADSSIIGNVIDAAKSLDFAKGINTLMPSKAPILIGMTYKGRTYAPMVLESIGQPLNAPIDTNGYFTELLVPMTLCTLTALDRRDWARMSHS